MKLYNSLTRTVDEFVPKDKNEVKIYTCGPTVYNFAHIGNLRSYLMEDLLVKTLEYDGYNVKRVMNITDVGHLSNDSDDGEDKMLKGAKREHKSVQEIAKFYTEAFFKDLKALNIQMPDVVEPATNCIDSFIKVISKLIEKGFAYIAGGNVYFDTSKLKRYHVFYNFKQEDLEVGVRDSVGEDTNKRNKNDFALWFTNSKFEHQALVWDSPWGVGYPGWHIECSCIAMKHLGDYLDIHCGGIDNAFPHHTNEIAQSESYLGHEWCHTWMHVMHLQTLTGKMSKSSGEFLTLSLFTQKGYTPMEYRFFCLSSHYRKPLMFSYDIMNNSVTAYKKLVGRISKLKDEGTIDDKKIEEFKAKFKDAIDSDLNSSMAISVLYEVLKDSEASDRTKLAIIKDFDRVLSLDLTKTDEQDRHQNESAKESSGLTDEEISKQIELRALAKKNKDYNQADAIRNALAEKGIALTDTPQGTTFTRN
jgi:cysteinyl-tRNA synthetase